MRREALLGTGILLAGIGEIQWFTAFLRDAQTQFQAVALFVAAAGLFLAAAGFFFPGMARGVLFLGLFAATLGHVAYFGLTLNWSWILVAAAALAAVGLGVSAWGSRAGRADLVRVGLGGAALAGLAWTLYDVYGGTYAYMVGNVFATVGFATAAIFATPETVTAS